MASAEALLAEAAARLLADHPVRGGFLRMPGLKELFGDEAELSRIGRGIDDAIESLDLELLPDSEFNRHDLRTLRDCGEAIGLLLAGRYEGYSCGDLSVFQVVTGLATISIF